MPKKILLADDSITIQKVVELTFSDGDYEVVATNNGTKAIEALATLRPDIILSDIIMPEKNGYEVCEFVKSHPQLKHVPVILLTGTFEPFDPDRAEKAGCDAVVTKPFESQGLIQKVEQLISSAQGAVAPTIEEASPPVAPPPADDGPFLDEPVPAAPEPPAFAAAPPPDDVFGDASTQEPVDSGETKLIPRMTFEDLQRMDVAAPAPEPEPAPLEPAPVQHFAPPEPEASPFAAAPEPPPPAMETEDSGETKLIPKMTFEDLQAMRNQPPPEPIEESASPFEDASAEPAAAEPGPASMPPQDAESEPAPWAPEPEASAPEPTPWASEPEASAPEPAPWAPEPEASAPELAPWAPEPEASAPEPAPWAPEPAPSAAPDQGAQPSAFSAEDDIEDSGETKLIPKLTFEDLQKMREEPAPVTVAPLESPEEPSIDQGSPFEDEPVEPVAEASPAVDDSPFDAREPSEPELSPEPEPSFEPAPMEIAEPFEEEEQSDPMMAVAPEESAEVVEPDFEPEPEPVDEEPVAPDFGTPSPSGALNQDDIDRIARRVVEMMSDNAVKDVAWEVIPEVAEMAVRERIRELEAEED